MKEILKGLITELTKKDVEDKYGKILFGEFQNNNRLVSGSLECDTEAEKELFARIKKYFIRNQTMPMDDLKELMKIRKYFPKTLTPNKYIKNVYRATIANKLKIWDILAKTYEPGVDTQIPTKKMFRLGDNTLWLKTEDVTYKPHYNMTSWTTDLSEAGIFNNIKKDSTSLIRVDPTKDARVVYGAKIDNTFFFNSNFIDMINNFGEEEVVRIAKKKSINTDLYVKMADFFDPINGWTLKPRSEMK